MRPRRVISLAGVADLGDAYRRWHGGVVRDLMGGSPEEVPERYAAADPIRLLPLDIPALLVHGARDETVSIEISRDYAEAARAAGGEVDLVEIEGEVGHRTHLDPRSAAWAAVVERLDDPPCPYPRRREPRRPICENARPWTSTSPRSRVDPPHGARVRRRGGSASRRGARSHEGLSYEIVRQLGALNLMGIPFPEEYGGGGGDTLAYALAVEELTRVDSSVAITLCAHTSLGTQPIYLFGSKEQKREWLPQLCSGERLGAFGLTEP